MFELRSFVPQDDKKSWVPPDDNMFSLRRAPVKKYSRLLVSKGSAKGQQRVSWPAIPKDAKILQRQFAAITGKIW